MKDGTREEITDLLTDKAFTDPKFRAGMLLKFTGATIKVTRIDHKNKRAWGVHVTTYNAKIVQSHTGHQVDSGTKTIEQYGAPWCEDCDCKVTDPSTEDGDKKALDRRDDEEQNQLADGTRIN